VRKFSCIELREYTMNPADANTYLVNANETSALRKSLVPLRLFATSETGGELNKAFHFYYYSSLKERDEKRLEMGRSEEWQSFLKDTKPLMSKQCSNIFAEAPFVSEMYGGMATEKILPSDKAIYEVRRYQLILGYDTVPKFIDFYKNGLGSKLSVSKEAGSHFCSLLYTELGSLNEVIELWRHEGVEGMEQSRVLSRQSDPWKKAIGNVAPLALSFRNTILRPVPFSNWR